MKGRARRGVTLIETALALAILSIVLAGAAMMMNDSAQRTSGRITAQKLQQVSEAARNYLKYNTEALMANTSSVPIVIPVARKTISDSAPPGPGVGGLTSLQGGGFLPTEFVDVNPFGQSHALLVRQPSTGRLEAIVTTVGGRVIPDAQLGSIATDAGAEAGFVPTKSTVGTTNRVIGTSGGWGTDTISWTKSAVGPTQGHAVTAMALDEGAIVADYLYRRDIGIPEANRMRTDLSMGDPAGTKNDVNDVRSINDRKGGTRNLEFNVDSFLTMRNGATSVRLGSDGVKISNTLKVGTDTLNPGESINAANEIEGGSVNSRGRIDAVNNIATSTGDVVAAVGNVAATTGNVTAGKNITASLGVFAKGGNVESSADVKGRRFFDIDKAGAYVVDPSDTSKFFDLKADSIDVAARAYGTTNVDGTRSLGSYLTNDIKVVKAYGPVTTGASSAIATCPTGYARMACSGARMDPLIDNCSEQNCGIVGSLPVTNGCQTTIDGDGNFAVSIAYCLSNATEGAGLVVGTKPGGVGTTDPGNNSCPVWAPGTYPKCVYVPPEPTKCPTWAPGSFPMCKPLAGIGVDVIQVHSVVGAWRFPSTSVACPAGRTVVGGGATCSASSGQWVADSNANGNGWRGTCIAIDKVNVTLQVTALCAVTK